MSAVSAAEPPKPLLPQLRLDDLLAQLQVRIAAVVGTRDRVHALLEAVVAIGRNLELDVMLRQVVEAAATLVDARYGALGSSVIRLSARPPADAEPPWRADTAAREGIREFVPDREAQRHGVR